MVEAGFFQALAASVAVSVAAENIVFARAFGVSTMIASAKNRRNLPGICLGVCFFTVISSAAAYAADSMGARSLPPQYVPLIFTVIIGVLYALTLAAAFVLLGRRFGRIKKYVHISAFNSVVMGTIFLSLSECETLAEYILFGCCSGAGFAAASYMLAGAYGRLYSSEVPRVFRGYPAVMIFTGIIAMAVYGLLGRSPSYM